MRVIGFNFTKLSAEKLKESGENIKINTEMDVSEISEAKLPLLKTKEGILEAKFIYKVNYDPGMARVVIEGKVLISMEEKNAEEILKGWKKKSLPEEFRMQLFNIILKKSTLKALGFCDEL